MTNAGSIKLSDDLEPIYLLELRLGNQVVRVDAPAGTACPLAINFRDPLHLAEIAKLELAPSVSQWSNTDPHYPKETGYRSNTSNHALAGPMQ